MNEFRSTKLDYIWLMVVLLHVIGSAGIALLLAIPYGTLLLNTIFWGYLAYANRSKKLALFLSAIGWSITMFILNQMVLSHLTSALMNMILLLYFLYLHYGDLKLLCKENHIRAFRWKEIVTIVPLTALLLIVAMFFNNISMLLFENHVENALLHVKDHWPSALLTLGVLPALVEELFFRGFVFKCLGNSRKAIVISALLFALGHMNFNQISYAFVMGLALAYAFYITDNLMVPISIHMLFNAYNILSDSFAKTAIISWIRGIHVGNYYLISVIAKDLSQKEMMMTLVIGFIVMIVTSLFIWLILKWVKGNEEIMIREAKEERQLGIAYYIGILICLTLSILIK